MTRWFFEKTSYLATLLGLKIVWFAFKILPRRWVFSFSDFLARIGFLLFHGFRTRSLANLRIAMAGRGPTDVDSIARRSLRNFFRSCAEIGIAVVSSEDQRRDAIPIDGREHLDASLGKGRGVIILSAHLGNFLLLGTRLALEGHPVSVLINQPNDGGFAKLMDKYRSDVKQSTIHARPRQQALRELTAVLRRNEIAVILADEYRRGNNGIPTDLFGRTVLARRGPATIASRTGAAVVPACVVRQPDDSLRLIIEPELELLRPGKEKEQIRANVLRMTGWLEKTALTYPDQWNWMNIRWWEDQASPAGAKNMQMQNSTS